MAKTLSMQYLFSNAAYPISQDQSEAIKALAEGATRAAAIRKAEWLKTSKRVKEGIEITHNPALAKRFYVPKSEPGHKTTGQIGHKIPFTHADIMKEADENGIIMDEPTAMIMADYLAELRQMIIEIHEHEQSMQGFEVIGRLLFAPKDAIGRAPVMHVDDASFTLHTTFAGACVKIHNGMNFADTVWDLMDRRKTDKTKTEESIELQRHTASYADEFSTTTLNDVLIMRGQAGLDLSDPEQRKRVCTHASSPLITVAGQVAATFFIKPVDNALS